MGDSDGIRRNLLVPIEHKPDRESLRARYGRCWNQSELEREYEVIGHYPPLVLVRRICDGVKGTFITQNDPRLYHSWQEEQG